VNKYIRSICIYSRALIFSGYGGSKMYKQITKTSMMLLLFVVSGSFLLTVFGQSTNQEQPKQEKPAQPQLAAPSAPSPAARATYRPTSNASMRMAYRSQWGIDDIRVRETASGSLIRLSYHVLDPSKAKLINDKKATPYLIDRKTGAGLQIPDMPMIGKLRQTPDPEKGLEYWMVFSNKGNIVKRGSVVDVVIGSFRISGLVVE